MLHNSLIKRLFNKAETKVKGIPEGEAYEFCPRCDANLTLQKKYRNDLPFWICTGCGEMLINPSVDADDNIAWICDKCGSMLNMQDGFSDNNGEWICTDCGYQNKIDKSELYVSEDEYLAQQRNPYKGLPDKDVLALSMYREIEHIDNRPDIVLVKNRETGQKYVKKLLTIYNRSIYDYLKNNPVTHMPVIYEIYESDNCLIIIEEYINGKTVADILNEKAILQDRAIDIGIDLCAILNELHNLPTPVIHRDIKPSNIIITPENKVYLLDVNAAKWYDSGQTDDTIYMGTMFYAAPEQAGYGLSASSAKSDIYALGVLLNVMTTGRFPKEERAKGELWNIIERCISLNPDGRYTAAELKASLEILRGKFHAEKADGRVEQPS
ncbi:MAG: protein kinase [Clostridiales bacterium]|nr:protein kinase [Clostridiales bacterium]